jgi:hypothetical protein
MKRPSDGSKPIDVNDLQKRLEELRRAWDRYFQGIDRVPPVPIREKLGRELNQARMRRDLVSTDRFRLQQVQQRYNSYGRLWDRQMREIEAGTFKRHLAKADRKRSAKTKDPDSVTFEAYGQLCKEAGIKAPNRSEFLAKLASKREMLESKHGHAIRFDVRDKDGRPSLMVIKADQD